MTVYVVSTVLPPLRMPSLLQSYDDAEGCFHAPRDVNVGSFPKDFRYGGADEYDNDSAGAPPSDNTPRILLMGLRR